MTIYAKKANYRKIYKNHYGAIPRDENNRTYDIHHIDGNRKNNDISNLVALSIQDHYDLHYSQNDFGACLRIAQRMKRPAEELAELSRKNAVQRVLNKTHNLLTRADGSSSTADRVLNDTHPWLGSKKSKDRAESLVASNSHPWQKSKSADKSPCFDSTIYTFKNTLTNQVVNMTRYDFYTTYNLSQSAVSNLLAHRTKTTKNWALADSSTKSLAKNAVDKTIYCFENIKTNEQVFMTRNDFRISLNLSHRTMYNLMSKHVKTAMSWRLAAQNAS